jgi:hypothetical protein
MFAHSKSDIPWQWRLRHGAVYFLAESLNPAALPLLFAVMFVQRRSRS